MQLPRLYPILDAGLLQRAGLSFEAIARELRSAGVRFLQYRDKDSPDELLLQRAALLRSIFPSSDSVLILNDRVHLLRAVGFEGVHVGQQDQEPEQVRALLGPDVLIGLSTHNQAQLLRAQESPVDYVAIGPVYATQSKAVPDPVVGLAGVSAARSMTARPLVAIGGITRANAAAVIAAGADAVAVISDLLPDAAQAVKEFRACE